MKDLFNFDRTSLALTSDWVGIFERANGHLIHTVPLQRGPTHFVRGSTLSSRVALREDSVDQLFLRVQFFFCQFGSCFAERFGGFPLVKDR